MLRLTMGCVLQAAFALPNEQKQTLLPDRCNGCGRVKLSLNSGIGNPWEVETFLTLDNARKKQWLQVIVGGLCLPLPPPPPAMFRTRLRCASRWALTPTLYESSSISSARPMVPASI